MSAARLGSTIFLDGSTAEPTHVGGITKLNASARMAHVGFERARTQEQSPPASTTHSIPPT